MAKSAKASRLATRKMRCAIYTRKSSEEGLEQAFNSLDAQREACAAFVLSQKHEGWVVLPACTTTPMLRPSRPFICGREVGLHYAPLTHSFLA